MGGVFILSKRRLKTQQLILKYKYTSDGCVEVHVRLHLGPKKQQSCK